jgi:hypothetical protein
MSLVSAFAAAAATQAFAIMGTQTLSIGGGDPVDIVGAETMDGSELMEYAQDPNTQKTCVCKRSAFDAAYPLDSQSYLKKSATTESRVFRVGSINRGRDFVIIALTGKERA